MADPVALAATVLGALETVPGVTVYDAPACYVVRRRFVDGWGRVVIRRERVCE